VIRGAWSGAKSHGAHAVAAFGPDDWFCSRLRELESQASEASKKQDDDMTRGKIADGIADRVALRRGNSS